MHHCYPKKIVEAVDRKLEQLSTGYQQVVVVYGDCGTAGALEPVLERYGAVRVRGPHCYEMFAGSDFDRITEERPATFFLTDWLVRNFDRAVVRGLGLDRYPDLRPMLFGNYEAILYLRQAPSELLAARAATISGYLELPLEIRDVRTGALEKRLASVVEA